MGLHLFFLPNYPGAKFIQGARFIPDSRVVLAVYHSLVSYVLTASTRIHFYPHNAETLTLALESKIN